MATYPNPAKNLQTKASQYVDVKAKNSKQKEHSKRLIESITLLFLEFVKNQVPTRDPVMKPV